MILSAIMNRRSIRKYKEQQIPREYLEEIIQAGIMAPSSKNRQPWMFTVVSGAAKKEMLSVMSQGLQEEKTNPLLPGSAPYLEGAWRTWEIMKQAPVIILIKNELAKPLSESLTIDERESEICNAQSIGAAIENMILTATKLGIGSLWICDTCFAQRQLQAWLGGMGELYAALALGYPAENPACRPRKVLAEVVEWRS